MDRYLEDTASAEPEILKNYEKLSENYTTTHDFWDISKVDFFL